MGQRLSQVEDFPTCMIAVGEDEEFTVFFGAVHATSVLAQTGFGGQVGGLLGGCGPGLAQAAFSPAVCPGLVFF